MEAWLGAASLHSPRNMETETQPGLPHGQKRAPPPQGCCVGGPVKAPEPGVLQNAHLGLPRLLSQVTESPATPLHIPTARHTHPTCDASRAENILGLKTEIKTKTKQVQPVTCDRQHERGSESLVQTATSLPGLGFLHKLNTQQMKGTKCHGYLIMLS